MQRFFTTLDTNSGYRQVTVSEADQYKTYFIWNSGCYKFVRIPFGLKNAPATLKRGLDIILARCKLHYPLVYLEEISIYSKIRTRHFAYLCIVSKFLQAAGISLRLKECNFPESSVDCLGHVILTRKPEVARKTLNP